MTDVQPTPSPASTTSAVELRPRYAWQVAIYASVLLWLAMAAGNAALYAVRPPGHWPVLEGIETVQIASLIPIALLLDRINRRSRASRVVTWIGVAAMVLVVLINIGFVTGAFSFGVGLIGGPVFVAGYLVVLGWLFAASALAWQVPTLPRGLTLLGIGAAITATLLFPAWALGLARHVGSR